MTTPFQAHGVYTLDAELRAAMQPVPPARRVHLARLFSRGGSASVSTLTHHEKVALLAHLHAVDGFAKLPRRG